MARYGTEKRISLKEPPDCGEQPDSGESPGAPGRLARCGHCCAAGYRDGWRLPEAPQQMGKVDAIRSMSQAWRWSTSRPPSSSERHGGRAFSAARAGPMHQRLLTRRDARRYRVDCTASSRMGPRLLFAAYFEAPPLCSAQIQTARD